MREITLNVVQGIGDIFWIYQKVSPYFDRINLNIMGVDHSAVQQRSVRFMSLFPKMGSVKFILTTSQQYDTVAKTRYDIATIIDNPRRQHFYAVNKPLEDGIRIEDIDPKYPIERRVALKVPDAKIISSPYILVYASGNKASTAWGSDRWFELIKKIYKNKGFGRTECILMGAPYDAPALEPIGFLMRHEGIPVSFAINHEPEMAVRLLRDAKMFIGYQSGLNILAENYNTEQVMIYFPWLKKMLTTWVDKSNIGTKFRPYTFDQSLAEIENA